jgi:uncharacterized cupin superfamily protein
VEVVNVLGDEWDEWPWPQPESYRWRHLAAGRRLGGQKLGGTVYELERGQKSFPYHWHAGNEEMLLVLSGRPTLRAPDGERELSPGDVVVFGRGPEGAHQLRNDSDERARVLMLSTRNTPEAVEYPDSRKVGISGRGIFRMLRTDAEVDYWEGES